MDTNGVLKRVLPPWRGLRGKIIAWFLIPTAIILSAVAISVLTASRRVTEDLVFERNADRAQLLANQLSSDLPTYQQALAAAASEMNQSDLDDLTPVLEALWPAGALQAFDGGAFVVDLDGGVRSATYGLRKMVGGMLPEFADRPW